MDDPSATPWGAIADAADCEPDAPTTPEVSQADVMGPTPDMMQQITPEMVAAGYQPGMTEQTVVVAGASKGPKVPLIVAAILVGFALLSFVIGGFAGASFEEALTNAKTGDYTFEIQDNGTLIHDDADNAGEVGWYLLISGDPKADENQNGIMDACEGINFSITDADGDDASKRAARISCSTDLNDKDSNANEPYFDIENHIIVARICHTIQDDTGGVEHRCAVGESFTVTNDAGVNMSVVDIDAMYIPIMEEAAGTLILAGGSFFAGCCSVCGGIIALIVGLLRFGGTKQPDVQFQIK